MSRLKAKKKKPHKPIHSKMYDPEAVRLAKEIYRERAAKDVDAALGVGLMLSCIILNDLFGFGGGRLYKFHEEMETRLSDYAEGKFTLDDVVEVYESLWQQVKAYAKRKGLNIEKLEG